MQTLTEKLEIHLILPAVLFSAYLVYGLVRPMLSVQRRKAVEEALDPEVDDGRQ